ncbi:NAD(P)-dependent oxidoreductase [Hydrogenophaga sp. PBL-H3]|uniref:NAD(P)-dependent oxidoreductase n=1 Tax=Hydrogenophaga sp. PBL-H3 TaxID=434010 RepID=UPI0022A739DE|nr:NAD(P)-dependent oxidoreductase [Hydrogenophaga sp. PBL-H3]
MSGRLAAAALDVFEREPHIQQALLQAPRVVLTPHIASATPGSRLATLCQAADNVLIGLDGRRPPNALAPRG